MAIKDVKSSRYQQLMKLEDERITIGVHDEEGSRTHPTPKETKDGPVDQTVAEVAANNELGLDVPRRSFLRDWVDSDLFHAAFKAGVNAITRIEEYAEPIRLDLEYSIVQRMQSGLIPPPNSPLTIQKKGHSRTLEETGTLIKSVKAKRQPK